MILITKQNGRWDRKTLKWGYPKLRNLSKVFYRTEDRASIQPPTVPGKQGWINTEIGALLRWEDDGGETT